MKQEERDGAKADADERQRERKREGERENFFPFRKFFAPLITRQRLSEAERERERERTAERIRGERNRVSGFAKSSHSHSLRRRQTGSERRIQ